jgi:hypothetical protein
VEDIGMMMSGIKTDHAEHGTADQEYHQPQLKGDDNFRCYQTHRQRQKERYDVTKLEVSMLFVYTVIPANDWSL